MSSYNYGFGTEQIGSNRQGSSAGNSVGSTFGRVVDIILDESHSRYQELGGSQAINGVLYRKLGEGTKESEINSLPFAYAGTSFIRRIPLLGEIVEIESGPGEQIDASRVLGSKRYYRTIADLWNHPHHNAFPDVYQNQGEVNLGENVVELGTINPLQAFPGDTLIEGRNGQSIRFTANPHLRNVLTDDSNKGLPVGIIRVGQGAPGNGTSLIVEDINKDASSIYMVADHVIPLEQAHYKRDAYDTVPDQAHVYKGSQLALNSGRVFINAFNESVLLSGTESVGLNARTLNLDGEKYIALDAEEIYLGKKARTAAGSTKEPVVLGNQSEKWMKDLIGILDALAKTLSTLPPAPPGAIGKLIARGAQMTPGIQSLKAQLPKLKSKKVFSE